VYTGARHDFAATFRSPEIDANTAWPWQQCVERGAAAGVEFVRDSRLGFGDRYSLRLGSRRPARAAWQATTLGPAFGERAFADRGRLRLVAWVRTRGLRGGVRIALRLHRAGRSSVFDVAGYEVFPSAWRRGRDEDWTRLEVETPRLTPAPDRVHLRLELEGAGTVWFDDLELQRLD